MNKSKIDWCDSTWNPVTGCLHGCKYCYAEKIANRFATKDYRCNNCCQCPDCSGKDKGECPQGRWYIKSSTRHDLEIPSYTFYPKKKLEPYPFGFEPTFHRYRLDEPAKKIKPQNIFVCSMADLFGDWVPDEWINEIMNRCCYADQHRYIFLTKNPIRYEQLKNVLCTDKHCWYGVTIENQDKYLLRGKNTRAFPDMNLFLSIEPLQGNIELHPFTLTVVKWVIIGAQTGPGAVTPKPEWVQSIIDQCRVAGVPVFLKDNLKWPEKIQEYPWQQ